MSDSTVHWYKSKVDWWLIPLLAIPPISSTVVLIDLLQRGAMSDIIIGIIAVVFVAVLYLGVIFPLRYRIDANYLTIRHGLFRQRIALDKIVEVVPTRNPLSSPALSLDRLRVQYGKGFFNQVMISPKARDEFLAELAKTAVLHREGDRLTSATNEST